MVTRREEGGEMTLGKRERERKREKKKMKDDEKRSTLVERMKGKKAILQHCQQCHDWIL